MDVTLALLPTCYTIQAGSPRSAIAGAEVWYKSGKNFFAMSFCVCIYESITNNGLPVRNSGNNTLIICLVVNSELPCKI